MHTIRSRARHAAWKSQDGINYNPFARTMSRTKSPDPEEPPVVPDSHSETCVSPTAETERHNQAENEAFAGPKRWRTSPPNSATTSHPPETPDAAPILEKEAEPSARSGEALLTSKNQRPDNLRKRFKIFPGKKENSEESVERTTTSASRSSKKPKKITLMSQFKVVFLRWINILLIAVPVGIALKFAHVDGKIVFTVNFIAIIPLAGILSYATEELALRVGETLGGLLNASFGNAVELIVSIQALASDQITIVKTSLIGSMLSNLLLVMGMSFFFGGVNRLEQYFNVTVAQTAASLLALCIGSLIIPTVFHIVWPDNSELDNVDHLSRGTAVILLLVYGCYLFFQLKSHKAMYNEPSQKVAKRKTSKVEEGSVTRTFAHMGLGATGPSAVEQSNLLRNPEEEDEKEEPELSVLGAFVTLAVSTALVAICSEFMVDGIHDVTANGALSTVFVGLILLPIVGNAAEHATAVTVACKDKMDLAIGVAVGSSMQIALLVLPLVVVIGWIMGKSDMNLYFDGFQIAVLFVAVLLVNYLIQDGKSHWLEGVLLMATYTIIAIAAFFYPNV